MAQDFTTPPEYTPPPGPVQEFPSPGSVPPPMPPKRSNTTLIIVIVLAVVLLCCCCLAIAGYYAWTNGDRWFNFNSGAVVPLLQAYI